MTGEKQKEQYIKHCQCKYKTPSSPTALTISLINNNKKKGLNTWIYLKYREQKHSNYYYVLTQGFDLLLCFFL